MTLPLYIDSDNAHGSAWGDVDDAFALAALFASGFPIAALASVAGNTSEAQAYENNLAMAHVAGYQGPCLRGSQVASFLATAPSCRIVALGPLTNIAAAVRAGADHHREIIVLGGVLRTRGRKPPIWPFEFNLAHDRAAATTVFGSQLPLTIFPQDVARRLYLTWAEVLAFDGTVGAHLAHGARRWFLRLRLLKTTGRFPVYDLAPALYAIEPQGFTLERTVAKMRRNSSIDWGTGQRNVTVCTALDRDALVASFRRLIRAGS